MLQDACHIFEFSLPRYKFQLVICYKDQSFGTFQSLKVTYFKYSPLNWSTKVFVQNIALIYNFSIFFFTDDLARDAIKEAFRQIEKYTCIQFSPWDGEKDFIEIIKGKG